ncbi:MAG TPA: RNA polymerase-binding protein DksA [Polynucleobacter sp.]|nr:RNA polymerase-binding protein DksA [Polynucleobacter sp.]
MTVKTPTKSTATAKAPSKAASAKAAKGAPLTEVELLKMSEKDYMNTAQLDFFRQKLLTLKDDILKNASETTEHLRENILVPDPADRATIEEEHALELRTRDRERKLLKKVEQALARIESGDYGWCEETGEPIGLNRLIARPTANLSLEAQERRELRQKLFGD